MLSTATPLMQRILTSSDWPVVAFLLEVPIKQYPSGEPKWFSSIQREEVPKTTTNELDLPPNNEHNEENPAVKLPPPSVPTEERTFSIDENDGKCDDGTNHTTELPSPTSPADTNKTAHHPSELNLPSNCERDEENASAKLLPPSVPTEQHIDTDKTNGKRVDGSNSTTELPSQRVPKSPANTNKSAHHLSTISPDLDELPVTDTKYSKSKKVHTEGYDSQKPHRLDDVPIFKQPLPHRESSEVLLKPFRSTSTSKEDKIQTALPDIDSLDGVPTYASCYTDSVSVSQYDDVSMLSGVISIKSCSDEDNMGHHCCQDFVLTKRQTPSGRTVYERKLRHVTSEYSSKERFQCMVKNSFSSDDVSSRKSKKRSSNTTATTSTSASPYPSSIYEQSPASSGVCSPRKYSGAALACAPLTRSDIAYLRGTEVCSDGTPTTPTTPATPDIGGGASEATMTTDNDGTDSNVSASSYYI